LAAFLLVVALVVRFAEAFAALREVAFDLPPADVFAAFRAFLGALRVAAFLADDFLAVLAVRVRRRGCGATGGINKGSDTSPSAANGM
jgi:hypothetical protein